MKRRNFLRDIALSIACTLVPRILQPVMPELPISAVMVDEFNCWSAPSDVTEVWRIYSHGLTFDFGGKI